MKIEITKEQLKAIIEITNDISAMIGCATTVDGFNQDDIWNRQIKLIDAMLNKNGYKRQYK